MKELENLATQLEQQVQELNVKMTLPQITSDYAKLSQVMEQLATVNAQLEQTLAEWENLE